MKFENGAIVHQVLFGVSANLVATFRYVTDADYFCQIQREQGGPYYVRTCLNSGEMMIFRPTKVEDFSASEIPDETSEQENDT